MSREEKKLLIMLSQTKMSLDQITTTMIMVKSKKHGLNLLIEYLNNTNEMEAQTIMKKAIEIMES